jgi:hypothetical protein
MHDLKDWELEDIKEFNSKTFKSPCDNVRPLAYLLTTGIRLRPGPRAELI